MIRVKTKEHSVSERSDNESKTKQKKGQYCICIYIFLEKLAWRNIYVALCTAADILYIYIYIYTWYLHDAATRGLRSIHHQTGGPGCRGAHRRHSQALRHSRKSTSLSETKGVWYLWRSEAASQALRPPSSLYTEEEQFMELFLEVKWRIKQNKHPLQLHQYICQFQVWYAAIY